MAEKVARQALTAAARRGAFETDWRRATIETADWRNRLGPQHFYLFSMKVLAFICLRQRRPEESREILDKLAEIDPEDSVGAAVIRDLIRGAAC